MSEKYDHGPLQTYEVVWQSGHVERIKAHQVIIPPKIDLFGTSWGPQRVTFHGEIDGKWHLVLAAPEDDIRSIRNLSATEAELS